MCQLTLVNLKSKELNTDFLFSQFFINTILDHQDGTGFFTPDSDGIWKTKNAASLLINLHWLMRDKIKGDSPIIGHVRKATVGKNNLKAEDSHPFESEHFILAHNGTLFFRDKFTHLEKDYKKFIDSETYLKRLQHHFSLLIKNKNGKDLKEIDEIIIKALNNAMEEMEGKFAFLIYFKGISKFKIPPTYYVVRGKQAKLHFTKLYTTDNNTDKKLEDLGIVVNTDEGSLFSNLVLFSNKFWTGKVKLDWTEIKLLQENSIYKLSDFELSRIGDITEVEHQTKTYYTTVYSGNNYKSANNYNTGDKKQDKKVGPDKFPKEIVTDQDFGLALEYISATFSLNPRELDYIFFMLTGLYISESMVYEAKEFFKVMKELTHLISTNKQKAYDELVFNTSEFIDSFSLSEKYSAKFPWFMNSTGELKKLASVIKKEEVKN